jgi:hypothetical protein
MKCKLADNIILIIFLLSVWFLVLVFGDIHSLKNVAHL